MKEQMVFILFGEAPETNAKQLNDMLADGWYVVSMCAMPSAMSTGSDLITRWYEPQCAVVIEREKEVSEPVRFFGNNIRNAIKAFRKQH